MTFNELIRRMNAGAFEAGRRFGEQAAQRVMPHHAQKAFLHFTPSYWTPCGLLPAKLDKVEVHEGRPQAYYSMVYRNPLTGRRERRAWRYVLRNGEPTEHKAFPVRVF